MSRIRECAPGDAAAILSIINAAAEAYRGVIPQDCWREPYMPAAELAHEMQTGVAFWGCEQDGALVGVMGIQQKSDVDLIRHAYVSPAQQRAGLGAALLKHLRRLSGRRMLVGTWSAATWAIRFYQRHALALVAAERAPEILRMYWDISDSQIANSVLLASPAPNGVETGAADDRPAWCACI